MDPSVLSKGSVFFFNEAALRHLNIKKQTNVNRGKVFPMSLIGSREIQVSRTWFMLSHEVVMYKIHRTDQMDLVENRLKLSSQD